MSYLSTYDTSMADPEMAERIRLHQARRPASWETVENRYDLRTVFSESGTRVVLLDCLTLWLSMQMCLGLAETDILSLWRDALESPPPGGLVIVSDETGLGVVPADRDTRAFRDLCGKANQIAAAAADEVILVVAGIPVGIKGTKG